MSARVRPGERVGSGDDAIEGMGLTVVIDPCPNAIGVRSLQRIHLVAKKIGVPDGRKEPQNPLLMAETCAVVPNRGPGAARSRPETGDGYRSFRFGRADRQDGGQDQANEKRLSRPGRRFPSLAHRMALLVVWQ
jgi:hypothetical protein